MGTQTTSQGQVNELMLSDIIPQGVYWKIAEPWMWNTPVSEAEEALIARAVDKRKREFRAGRNCAHALFSEHNIKCAALLKGKQREPAWPSGWVGSISHTAGLCVVAIAPASAFISIGLDVEQATPLSDEIRDVICSPEEQDAITALKLKPGSKIAGYALDKLIFSAKESIHKTYFPLNYHTLDFLDARIDLCSKNHSFEAKIVKPEPKPLIPIHRLEGRYCFKQGYVASFIALKAQDANETLRT